MSDTRDPAQDLADGFAAHVAQWAQGDAAIVAAAREAARRLSLATSRGHVCVTLTELAGEDAQLAPAAALRERLLASGVTGTPETPRACPLILDGEDRLYLHRYFDYERRLAARLAAKRAAVRILGGTVGLRDVEVLRAPGAPPVLRLSPAAQERLADLGMDGLRVSLTHGRTHAAAVVLALRNP